MLFISDLAWIFLKIIHVGLMVCLQRHAIFSDLLWPMGGKFLKHMLTYLCCSNYNEINMCHSDIEKYVSYKKQYN